jgi:hypothetical protein
VEVHRVSQPDQPRPVPGPSVLRPSAPAAATARPVVPGPPASVPSPGPSPFAGLSERPVSEHVAVFEAEHDRLQRELATIDQL